LLIENSDFVFVAGESDSAGVEFEALAVEVALELSFFGDLVSEVFGLVSQSVIKPIKLKFKHEYPLPSG